MVHDWKLWKINSRCNKRDREVFGCSCQTVLWWEFFQDRLGLRTKATVLTKKCNWRQKQDVSRQYSKQTNCTGSHKNVLCIMYVAKETITFFKIWFSWWPVTQNQTPFRAETSTSCTAVKQHYLYRWRWHLMWNLNPASLLHYNLRPQKCCNLAGLLFQRCGVGGGVCM